MAKSTQLVGRTIKEIRPMTEDERDYEAWSGDECLAMVIVLDDGTRIYPAKDPEGNGPGVLKVLTTTGSAFQLLAPPRNRRDS